MTENLEEAVILLESLIEHRDISKGHKYLLGEILKLVKGEIMTDDNKEFNMEEINKLPSFTVEDELNTFEVVKEFLKSFLEDDTVTEDELKKGMETALKSKIFR